MSNDYAEILRRLAEHDVRFVLIGGLALNAWGVLRGTKDVDVVPDPDPANVQRLGGALAELGGQAQTAGSFVSSAFGLADLIARGQRVLVETRSGPVDVVQALPGVPGFDVLLANAERAELLGFTVLLCSLGDLRAMKRAAGRPQDLVDLENLDVAHGPEA